MSADTRRKIKQLRALAASTTFPEEARSARIKADKLAATLAQHPSDHVDDALTYLAAEIMKATPGQYIHLNKEMMLARWREMFEEAMGRKPT